MKTKSKLIVKTEKTKRREIASETPFWRHVQKFVQQRQLLGVGLRVFVDGFDGLHIIDHYFIIVEQKSFWVFKLSLRLCVWYSRGLCVVPVFASSVCLETHCVCRRFLQRICIQLRAQNRTALHIQKIPKKRVPTPPNPPVRNHHHTGIWLLSTLCGFYIHLVPKGGRFAKESKKKHTQH